LGYEESVLKREKTKHLSSVHATE